MEKGTRPHAHTMSAFFASVFKPAFAHALMQQHAKFFRDRIPAERRSAVEGGSCPLAIRIAVRVNRG